MPINQSVERKDAWAKVTGEAKYTADMYEPGLLYARLKTSIKAHAKIKNINIENAQKIEGVKSIVTGQDISILTGVTLQDRPILAMEKVRYYGEVIAIVIATSEDIAEKACEAITVEYEDLSVINTVIDALKPNATLVHDNATMYLAETEDVFPVENSNIASSYKIRKGNIEAGFTKSDYIIEKSFSLKKSDHVAMEVRVADAKISSDGEVTIWSSTQSPYKVKKLVSKLFNINEGNVIIKVGLVGGGFGGKSPVFLELLAYIASQAVGGKKVRIVIPREQDFITAPTRLGLDANIKMGASKDGKIQAAQMCFNLDTGAYTDISPNMSKAIAVDCSGPYNIENLFCDSLCVYTNHNFSTAYRGFSHESYTFCIERTIDELAKKCGIDELEFRRKNSILPGNLSPTQVELTESNSGNVISCIDKLKQLIKWEEGNLINIGDNKVRAKGLSLFWKTPNPNSNASAAATITFNTDGSINLNIGAVEIGSGSRNQLAQILAQKLRMDYSRIYINTDISTRTTPEYWKTVASMSIYLLGRAILNAADDLISGLKRNASIALKIEPEDLDYGEEKIYVKSNPKFNIGFQDLAFGVKIPESGNILGKPVIGKGSYIMNHISTLAEDNGKGKTGQAWTVGAQAVEIELDLTEYTYRLINAATVIDVGKILDLKTLEASIKGGMSMGLSLATREEFQYSQNAILLDTSLRTYKLLHIGAEPHYLIDYVETPQIDSPYGARLFSEHGIIGMPAALANALSLAADVQLDTFPITSETIFNLKRR